ncbi:tyrosine-type recombinase/integrase [Paenibacillus aceris]|uniref:Integrase/recombinase XerC n=1 Tax=Paenibacillus aceris TaxID=869555 RepID=A0ABS4I2Q8_9BACL|nr:tyrosine-type recombinase/integrase [Paenibacillus aceris]MBP1965188.1 integrase/recombinase XerC [Paenibacillus aceris]NHW33168.1 tyrosine-type recombinase/integrase [Paenibacillus aceris]
MEQLKNFLVWLKNEGKDEKTISAYKTTVDQFLEWVSGTYDEKPLSEIKPIDIKEYIGYMKHTLNRKQATVNKATASLKTYFAYLANNGEISDNPMTRIRIQKVQSSEQIGETGVSKWMTKEEQDRFISYLDLEKNEFKRLRNLAIIDVMLYSGLRVAEVEELKVDDVKVNGDVTLTIREGKKGKYATVTLVSKHNRNLRNWLKQRQALTDDRYVQSPYLFVSERTGQLTSRGMQVMLDKYAKLARMDNVTPHRLRHSFCKNLANSGASIEIIRRLARHENIQTTAIYIDPSHQEQINALRKM